MVSRSFVFEFEIFDCPTILLFATCCRELMAEVTGELYVLHYPQPLSFIDLKVNPSLACQPLHPQEEACFHPYSVFVQELTFTIHWLHSTNQIAECTFMRIRMLCMQCMCILQSDWYNRGGSRKSYSA